MFSSFKNKQVLYFFVFCFPAFMLMNSPASFSQNGKSAQLLKQQLKNIEASLKSLKRSVRRVEENLEALETLSGKSAIGSGSAKSSIHKLERRVRFIENKMMTLEAENKRLKKQLLNQASMTVSPAQKMTTSDDQSGSGNFAPSTATKPIIAFAKLAPDRQKIQLEYDKAYTAFAKRDYQSSRTLFAQFLKKYPNDPLSINANYWFGETYYQRGDYKSAARVFLKSYRSSKAGTKAPDNLLKLAMSLQRLGKNKAACATFSELQGRFSNLPTHLQRQLSKERERARCS